ncbi:GTPase, partial [Alienimonas sp. DA493]|uniref:GTPase n=1 Tax=Alienimonas sp. DA493 TaxID=3373605 RepID=UPI0037548D7C
MSSELDRLDQLARIDGLIRRVREWAEEPTGPDRAADGWEPLSDARGLLRRALDRAEAVRVRLEAPLVVATFGGTGTGKSTLVNALVGEEVAVPGKQRPTTTTPTLVAHPDTDLAPLGLPLDRVRVKRADAATLREFVLIDCPDPDTTEVEAEGEGAATNLGRLRELLPHCDVLLVVSTQQKYRNARVADELLHAARGCRLLFVQTHAAEDGDIREDWRRVLGERFEVAAEDLYFVDSVRALAERNADRLPTGEFARLLETLRTELSEHARVAVRRANLLDLLHGALDRADANVRQRRPALDAVGEKLAEEREALTAAMTGRLKEELLGNPGVWERRLADAVATAWGVSPFSISLRFYNGIGGYITSSSLFRARNAAAVALVGATMAGQKLRDYHAGNAADAGLDQLGAFGQDDGLLRDARFRLQGFTADAGLPGELLTLTDEQIRDQGVAAEGRFLEGVRGKVEALIKKLAAKNSRTPVRLWYEILLLSLPTIILLRAAKNFFWDTFLRPLIFGEAEVATAAGPVLYGGDYWIAGAVFASLWAGLLVMLFSRRLRRGLDREVNELARSVSAGRTPAGLFPALEAAVARAQAGADRLHRLAGEA